MSHRSRDKLFRQAAEAEGGMPVSAGARIIHVRTAEQKGRAVYVDLSAVPEEKRAAVIVQIKELVNRASSKTPTRGDASSPKQSSKPD
jgi:hypothetical protein